MEVIEGAPPAEYGGKTSVIIVVTTRSGLGASTPHGEITASYGTSAPQRSASTSLRRTELGQLHLHRRTEYRPVPRPSRVSGDARQGQRGEFLRPPRLQAQRLWTAQLNLGFTRSWFQTPNSWTSNFKPARLCPRFAAARLMRRARGRSIQSPAPLRAGRSALANQTFNIAPAGRIC